MQFFKRLLSRVAYTPYSKKVDVLIRNILSSKKVRFIPIIILFRKPVDAILESRVKRLGLKIKYHLPFIQGICGSFPINNFDTLSGLLEISCIYYDGKAFLMEEASLETASPPSEEKTVKAIYLSGKGVTVAFIDSGIYPHPDLTRPRNRIVAFKDFINNLEHPYDDNGHGTACIGAAFGASIEGKFKAPAYDAQIVCAKAFDALSMGCFSDILGAMQWISDIREKQHIKIVVLPFGTSACSKRFDILGLAAKALWEQGLFVCASAGNMGPGEGTITSPGAQPEIYTVGACTGEDRQSKAASFSSRGPVSTTQSKPDALMPGVDVTGLHADIAYKPLNYKNNMTPLSPLYREINGSSASASLAAAAAALLYQKNDAFKPEDIKSILKICCQSINEPKTVQGAGRICLNKIEEWQ